MHGLLPWHPIVGWEGPPRKWERVLWKEGLQNMEAGGEAGAGAYEVWEVETTVDDVLKLVGVIARGLDILWGTMWSSVSWLPTMGTVIFSAWCCWSLCPCCSMHYFVEHTRLGDNKLFKIFVNCFIPLIWHIEICISSSADICLVFILPFMTFLIWATVCTSTEKKEIYV